MSDNDPPPLSESEDDNEDDPPPAKQIRTKLPIPACERCESLQRGLLAIEKLIRSKKTAYCACAIQSHLQMVVNNGCHAIEASEMAAESQGFARKWGGRLVRIWVRRWILWRELPVSLKGKHVKVFSLLDDPSWSMDPKKLMEFSKDIMVTKEAEKYLCHVVESEMPRGLKKYLEVELFPRIQLKVARGVSVRTARRWLHREGFKFTEHKKALYYDGHDSCIEKKGVGRGMHQSDIICSTHGWIKKASQSLEYGKNYEGYWTGELFVKQLVEKIIPAFEELHGPEYQALIMVDNSQGHSAYSTDALLVSRMNMWPGGKQARLRDGWFMCGDEKITQPMIFPQDHPEFPDMPKGMRERYLRNNCDYTFNTLKDNLLKALASVELKTIRLSGMDAKAAQTRVKEFSSRIYTSHRRVPETLARQFDA
ncbi:hypothetical protein BDZ94DRAFT_1293065 [Collybia nuda]|uniref:DDE-1 domain-containing protein n=1 Tax=Collybia nuda TaxID=64659 RepID=A0A9P5XST1_9AGAR|nr:hypothetical protein BDZ94DRAFT_1293065 [Collybia nuda]